MLSIENDADYHDIEYKGPGTNLIFACECRCGNIKFGCTTSRDLSSRLCALQHCSVGDETCLGMRYCRSAYEARKFKKYIRNLFQSKADCIAGSRRIREFIREYFEDATTEVEFSREFKREYDLDRCKQYW